MEYTWRTTPESLTVSHVLQILFYLPFLTISSFSQLLDDDENVIGELYSDRNLDSLLPAALEGTGLDYLDIEPLSSDELPELLGRSLFFITPSHSADFRVIVTYLLMHTLRDRVDPSSLSRLQSSESCVELGK